ncbi:uncharacterized membrane protein (DUF485 family) [Terracoccus luteus]|uniref:Uncharacterized membrane protein (DUF485 family) n=2 Tax=Terracoccus luteus TaxID=53356 RepID=A0A495XW77_9MICO|nr:uncharacterized membrane protein (DUF485 family) [Terracoccus luteus]
MPRVPPWAFTFLHNDGAGHRARIADGGDPVSNVAPDAPDDPNVVMQNSDEFAELRTRFRKFVFPMTAGFLAWYFLYVFLAVFAKGFMGTRVVGNVTWGLILGLLQFVTTFAITMIYVRWAGREFDPRAEKLARRIGGRQ